MLFNLLLIHLFLLPSTISPSTVIPPIAATSSNISPVVTPSTIIQSTTLNTQPDIAFTFGPLNVSPPITSVNSSTVNKQVLETKKTARPVRAVTRRFR